MEERIEIISISPPRDKKIVVQVLIKSSNGSQKAEFAFAEKIWKTLSLSMGIINQEALADIEFYSEVSRAYFSAYASFAYSPSSLKALKQKLYQKGFSKNVCNEAIAIVEKDGYVKEGDIAVRRAQIFISKLWGRLRIIAKLKEEGFSDGAIREAEDFISNVEFEKNCSIAIKKQFGEIPADTRDREKMYAYLSRQGYVSADIHKAVRLLMKEK